MREKEFLIRAGWPVAAAVLLALAGYLTFADRYEDAGRRLAEERGKADRIRVNLENSQKLVDDLTAARENVSEYVPELFWTDQAQLLIDRIEERAARNGVVMVDIQLDVPEFMEARKGDEPMLPVPFQASFAGDFFSLGSFLSALEKAPIIYKVTETELLLTGGGEKGLMLTVKGAVRFFSRDLVERYLGDAA